MGGEGQAPSSAPGPEAGVASGLQAGEVASGSKEKAEPEAGVASGLQAGEGATSSGSKDKAEPEAGSKDAEDANQKDAMEQAMLRGPREPRSTVLLTSWTHCHLLVPSLLWDSWITGSAAGLNQMILDSLANTNRRPCPSPLLKKGVGSRL